MERINLVSFQIINKLGSRPRRQTPRAKQKRDGDVRQGFSSGYYSLFSFKSLSSVAVCSLSLKPVKPVSQLPFCVHRTLQFYTMYIAAKGVMEWSAVVEMEVKHCSRNLNLERSTGRIRIRPTKPLWRQCLDSAWPEKLYWWLLLKLNMTTGFLN